MCCKPGTLTSPVFGLIAFRLLEITLKKKKSHTLCKLVKNIFEVVMSCLHAELQGYSLGRYFFNIKKIIDAFLQWL